MTWANLKQFQTPRLFTCKRVSLLLPAAGISAPLAAEHPADRAGTGPRADASTVRTPPLTQPKGKQPLQTHASLSKEGKQQIWVSPLPKQRPTPVPAPPPTLICSPHRGADGRSPRRGAGCVTHLPGAPASLASAVEAAQRGSAIERDSKLTPTPRPPALGVTATTGRAGSGLPLDEHGDTERRKHSETASSSFHRLAATNSAHLQSQKTP